MKAILLLDEMPKSCLDCKLYSFWTCMATRKNNIDNNDCYKECPLKELPKKKELITKKIYKYLPINFYNDGFNACIDEILGGEE